MSGSLVRMAERIVIAFALAWPTILVRGLRDGVLTRG
jgi:hypothetical protein